MMLASLSGAVLATRQEQPQQQLLKACLHSGPRNHLAPRAYLLDIPPPGDMRVTSRTLAALSFSDLQKLRPHFVQYRTIKETLHKELLFKLAHKPPYRSDRKYPRHYHYQLGWQGFNFW